MKKLRVLVGCETFQRLTTSFLNNDCHVFTCDYNSCCGPAPALYLQENLLSHLKTHSGDYDMFVCFPPSFYLNQKFDNFVDSSFQEFALSFFHTCCCCGIKYISMVMPYSKDCSLPWKPSQIVSVSDFGSKYDMKVSLWLNNLPPLMSSLVVQKTRKTPSFFRCSDFQGLCDAMALQWSDFVKKDL